MHALVSAAFGCLCLSAVAAIEVTSCARAPTEAAAVAPAPPPTESIPAGSAALPHGDHEPHHGGTVWMYKDVHFEVVLDPGGHHRVYFSDATREDLPAAVASSLTLTVERPGAAAEIVRGGIDDHGESWLADGAPVKGNDVSARVAFSIANETYWIDMPFVVAAE